ncbi:hypothetical protein QQG55_22815 [Brugia pahangi]
MRSSLPATVPHYLLYLAIPRPKLSKPLKRTLLAQSVWIQRSVSRAALIKGICQMMVCRDMLFIFVHICFRGRR